MSILETLEQRRAGWAGRAAVLRREIDQHHQEPPYMDTADLITLKEKNLDLAEREIRMLDILIRAAKSGEAENAK